MKDVGDKAHDLIRQHCEKMEKIQRVLANPDVNSINHLLKNVLVRTTYQAGGMPDKKRGHLRTGIKRKLQQGLIMTLKLIR